MKPGEFIPFQMRQISESAYKEAIKYINDRSSSVWTIVIKYMSEGAQFKFDESARMSYRSSM